ncbi:hypothetical protein BURKHO8Y_580027 [Burkholderia sp. 8Y]|nr:hypothetical protein BURKHO8Y_580027 [Burkholderia sp. 8Y]
MVLPGADSNAWVAGLGAVVVVRRRPFDRTAGTKLAVVSTLHSSGRTRTTGSQLFEARK